MNSFDHLSLTHKLSAVSVVSAKDKFKMMDQQSGPSTAAVSKPSFAKSPTSIKDNLLKWAAFKTKGYPVSLKFK